MVHTSGITRTASDLPFILVVFLIGSVATTRLRTIAPEIEVPTAELEEAGTDRTDDPLLLAVAMDGTIRMDGQSIAMDSLSAALRQVERSREIWIAADRRVPYGSLHPVLRALETEGRQARLVEVREE